MSWLNPTALFGLVALAVPILVHLFGRRLARVQRFPTLRLLKDTLPTPTTRSRPSDLLLLLLRGAVIVAAVLGLAQPHWSTATRSRSAQRPARAILVDTSASLRRLTSGDTTAIERARLLARRMLDSAREGIVIETADPGRNVSGAASWLESRAGVRELIIVSDFQLGAVEEGQFAAVPPGIGVWFVPVVANGAPAVMPDSSVATLRVSAQLDRTSATWTESAIDTVRLAVLAADRDSNAVRAAVNAARAVRVASGSVGKVAVVFPSYVSRQALIVGAGPLDTPWQGDLLHRLTRDPLLKAVSASARVISPCPAIGAPVARNGAGEVVATIARAGAGAGQDVLIFACVEPGTLASTAILASVATAVDPVTDFGELEPVFVPDEKLRRWERPATEIAPPSPDDSPDGRWFWLTAIALLLTEEWVRRRPQVRQPRAVTEVSRERVA